MPDNRDRLPPNIQLMATWVGVLQGLPALKDDPAINALDAEFKALGDHLATANIRMTGEQINAAALLAGISRSLAYVSGGVSVQPGGYNTPELEICPNEDCGRWRTKK